MLELEELLEAELDELLLELERLLLELDGLLMEVDELLELGELLEPDGLLLEPGEEARVQPWIHHAWAELDGSRLRLTAAGWLRLDALAADLTVLRSR